MNQNQTNPLPTQDPFAGIPNPEPAKTSLTLLQLARQSDTAGEGARLDLTRRYFGPAWAFFLDAGLPNETARDRAIDFLVDFFLVEKKSGGFRFTNWDPGEKGLFRNYVFAAVRNSHLGDLRKWHHERRFADLFLTDQQDAENSSFLADTSTNPELLWNQRCAIELIARAIETVRQDRTNEPELFDALFAQISKDPDRVPYDELAATFGLGVGALRVRCSRLREKIAAAIKAELRADGVEESELEQERDALDRLIRS